MVVGLYSVFIIGLNIGFMLVMFRSWMRYIFGVDMGIKFMLFFWLCVGVGCVGVMLNIFLIKVLYIK